MKFKKINRKFNLPRLYCVLDASVVPREKLLFKAQELMEMGVRLFQYRDKEASDSEYRNYAKEILGIVSRGFESSHSRERCTFIVNDRLEIAKEIGADGVHIGQGDLVKFKTQNSKFKNILGELDDLIVGISASNLEEAKEAVEMGVDYIGAGAIWGTPTKKDVEILGLSGLKEMRKEIKIPIVAIGGINFENCGDVFKVGADSVAMVRAFCKEGVEKFVVKYIF